MAPDRAELVTFADTLANTGKFVTCCPVKHSSARAWVEMGRMVTGQLRTAVPES